MEQGLVHVPAGRGPFQSWEQAAIDALVECAPYAARWTDWSPGGALTLLETYNGQGYANRGVPSPYIWSGTDQYTSGKYVRDGVYDPSAVDKQLGCACLIKSMIAIDPTITFTGATITPVEPDPAKPVPAKSSLLDLILNFITAIFGGKK
jgi:lysozyme family protein